MRSAVAAARVAVLACGLAGLSQPAAADEQTEPTPVHNASFADPAVVRAGRTLVAFSTGADVPLASTRGPRGPWRPGTATLPRRPAWASANGDIWAVDVARVRDRWLLYYAAPVPGIVAQGRCIGVAASRRVTGPFRTVGDRPLVCPAYADTPPALDRLLPRDRTLPRAGVIDPSYVRDSTGAYLVYKTDRIPSSVRILPLASNGTRVRPGSRSRELLRSPGVIENPVLVRRPYGYALLVSVGDYTRCSYRTDWYRSERLLDWSAATHGVLLDRRRTGLCGAGGADLLDRRGTGLMVLHGWTCFGTARPCPPGKWDRNRRARAVRALYAARLAWRDGAPYVAGWY